MWYSLWKRPRMVVVGHDTVHVICMQPAIGPCLGLSTSGQRRMLISYIEVGEQISSHVNRTSIERTTASCNTIFQMLC